MGQRMSTVEAGDGADGAFHGEAGGEGDPEGFAEGERGLGEDAEVQAVAGRGVPGVAAAAAAARLRVGEIEGAFGSAVGGGFEQQGVGGLGRGEVVQACGEAGADERGTERDGVELFARTHMCILTLMLARMKDGDHRWAECGRVGWVHAG